MIEHEKIRIFDYIHLKFVDGEFSIENIHQNGSIRISENNVICICQNNVKILEFCVK